jgi:hypothetical protein
MPSSAFALVATASLGYGANLKDAKTLLAQLNA